MAEGGCLCRVYDCALWITEEGERETCLKPVVVLTYPGWMQAGFLQRWQRASAPCWKVVFVQFSSVGQSCPTLCIPMDRPPCPSPTPVVYSNSCPLSRWYHPTISSFVISFSSCLQSFPASWSFQMSQFFEAGSNYIWLLYWVIIHRGKVYNSMVLDILHYLIVAKYIQQNSPFKSL